MIIEKILNRFGYYNRDRRPVIFRSFAGANTGNLYNDWTTINQSINAEIRSSLKTLRARSRQLERDNDYAKKFLRMVKTNVVGKDGVLMQSQIMNNKGKPDNEARKKIENAFDRWKKKGNCDVTGNYSLRDIQKLVMGTMARDGEILIRKIYGFDNEFNFALQLIEPDHLDEKHNDTLPNGNKIKLGVEFDQYSRPVAYWIYKTHPGDFLFGSSFGDKTRIPAREMMHIFIPMRVSQARGVPWMHAALTRLNMLGAYEEAELVAARIGAAKGGFYENESGDGEYTGDSEEDGNPIQEVEPGHYEVLPKGMKFKAFDPQHPTTAFDAFEKAVLRGISSGLDVSYNYLANDLEGVNYSSIRAGVLDERDVWRDLQRFLIEHFLEPIFNSFLDYALLKQKINLPMDFEKFSPVKWQPRGWHWVDPMKDIRAKQMAIDSGFETHSDVAAEQGKDYEENLIALAEEKEMREKHKVLKPDEIDKE